MDYGRPRCQGSGIEASDITKIRVRLCCARTLRQRRNRHRLRPNSLPHPSPFVTHKEKRAVLDDWAAKYSAKLILVGLRLGAGQTKR